MQSKYQSNCLVKGERRWNCSSELHIPRFILCSSRRPTQLCTLVWYSLNLFIPAIQPHCWCNKGTVSAHSVLFAQDRKVILLLVVWNVKAAFFDQRDSLYDGDLQFFPACIYFIPFLCRMSRCTGQIIGFLYPLTAALKREIQEVKSDRQGWEKVHLPAPICN